MVWRYILAITLSAAILIYWWMENIPPPQPKNPVAVAPADPAAAEPNPAVDPAGPAPEAVRVEPKRGAGEKPAAEPIAAPVAPRPGRPEPAPDKELWVDITGAQLGAKELPPAANPRTTSDLQDGAPDGDPPNAGAGAGDPASARIRFKAMSRGGTIGEVFLPEFGKQRAPAEPCPLLSPPAAARVLSLGVTGVDFDFEEKVLFDENWDLEEVDGGIRFANSADTVKIAKTVRPGTTIPAGGGEIPDHGLYHLEVDVELKNDGAEPRTLNYRLYGASGITTESTSGRGAPGSDFYLTTGRWSKGDTVTSESIEPGDVIPGWDLTGAAWIGVSNNYFAGLLFPLADAPGLSPQIIRAFAVAYPDEESVAALTAEGGDLEDAYKNLMTGLESVRLTIAPGETVTHRYGVFLGPRDPALLGTYEALNFEAVNDYNFLIRFFVGLLSFLKGLAFNSWGFGIICLTVLVKICLHPLNRKSQTGMHRFQKQMQKVKPEMDEIKERLKDDRMKQNQEMQALFKQRGINPGQQMGGCLLILLQMPIWISLYKTLQYAIGLRQAPFLWIEDLTQPDHLFHMGIQLPLIGGLVDFTWFNLLPLLYVIFTIINQRMQPKPDDPQMRAQYQMMTYMMVFFGLIFYGFPAGFMLYIMTSTLIGIFESKMIKRNLAREEEAGVGVEVITGDGPSAGSGGASGGALYPAKAKGGGGADAKKGGNQGKNKKGRRKR